MNKLLASAFVDEMEKLAAGPLIVHMSDPSSPGKHVKASTFLNNPPERLRQIMAEVPAVRKAAEKGQSVLFLPSPEGLSKLYGPAGGQAAYNTMRRHEMTHWLRDRRGKMKGVGEPGLRNVLRSAREEMAAHLSQTRTRGLTGVQREALGKLVGPGTIGSVKANYAYMGGARKAALGGTASKILKALKRFR
tara:strand:- start:5229 stop:5801 length:573 start_codon:yes stop_codon:yes gene_type:complete